MPLLGSQINIKLSDDEDAEWRAAANEQGERLNTLIRKTMATALGIEHIFEDVQEAMGEQRTQHAGDMRGARESKYAELDQAVLTQLRKGPKPAEFLTTNLQKLIAPHLKWEEDDEGREVLKRTELQIMRSRLQRLRKNSQVHLEDKLWRYGPSKLSQSA